MDRDHVIFSLHIVLFLYGYKLSVKLRQNGYKPNRANVCFENFLTEKNISFFKKRIMYKITFYIVF